MIFASSMYVLVKKAMPGKSRQLSVQSIIQNLPLDPTGDAGTQMDVLILGPQDFRGAAAQALPKAIEKAHPSVCIIYICSTDKEAAICPEPAHVMVAKRLKTDVIVQAISQFYGKDIQAVQATHSSRDDTVLKNDVNPTPPRATAPKPAEPEPEPETPVAPETEPALAPEDEDNLPPPTPVQRTLPPTPVENVQAIRSINDWDVLCKQLSRDAVIADALLRSAEFNGLKQTMDALQVKMNDVMADSRMTNEQKMAALKQFATQRSTLASAANARVVDDFLKLWGTIHSVAEHLVTERISEIQTAVLNAKTKKSEFEQFLIDGDHDAQQELADLATELVNIQSAITNLYAFAYKQTTEEVIPKLNDGLPSENSVINTYFGQSAEYYRTDNAEDLVNKLFKGLRESNISMTQVQDQIVSLINTLFMMVKKEADVIAYHKEAMAYLRANHVEDVIIRDTLLKDCFRLVVGSPGTGLTATTCMYAGMMSRRGNTLVVDLTGHAKYERYGHTPVPYETFMNERIQNPLTYVVGPANMEPEQVAEFMNETKSRMSYYNCLIVVLDASQSEVIDQVGREALSIAYITDCSSDSLGIISECYAKARSIPNVATLLCAIDAPVDASVIIDTLKMDISRCRLILLPYSRDIRKAAVMHTDPSTFGDVLRQYEDAFRI